MLYFFRSPCLRCISYLICYCLIYTSLEFKHAHCDVYLSVFKYYFEWTIIASTHLPGFEEASLRDEFEHVSRKCWTNWKLERIRWTNNVNRGQTNWRRTSNSVQQSATFRCQAHHRSPSLLSNEELHQNWPCTSDVGSDSMHPPRSSSLIWHFQPANQKGHCLK